eukprot:1133824-Rhodomonas_salina.1
MAGKGTAGGDTRGTLCSAGEAWGTHLDYPGWFVSNLAAVPSTLLNLKSRALSVQGPAVSRATAGRRLAPGAVEAHSQPALFWRSVCSAASHLIISMIQSPPTEIAVRLTESFQSTCSA